MRRSGSKVGENGNLQGRHEVGQSYSQPISLIFQVKLTNSGPSGEVSHLGNESSLWISDQIMFLGFSKKFRFNE